MTENPPPPAPGEQPPPNPTPPPASAAPIDYSSGGYPGPYLGPPADQDARNLGMLANLLGILGFLGPLIVWLVKKDAHPFVDDQGKESLNFQITLIIAWAAAIALTCLTVGIGGILFPVILVGNIIMCVMGAMKAKEGMAYRYPFAIRLIK